MYSNEVISAVQELGELRDAIKDMQSKAKELEQIVKPALVGAPSTVLGDYAVTVEERAGRETLDKVKVEELCRSMSVPYGSLTKTGAPFSVLKMVRVG